MELPSEIVYKYRDWENRFHKQTLLKNQIYLASPKDFNDPFDCRINANFSLFTAKEEYDYITQLAISGYSECEKRKLNLASVIKDLEIRLSNKKEFQKFTDEILYKNQDNYYAIFSCALKWDNILMWSHYANYHKGFCVGFWTEKIIQNHLFGKLGRVDYRSNFPKIKPRVVQKDDLLIINSFIETHTKAKVWSYESEYRFMSNSFPSILTQEERIITIPDNFIAEVILGINMPDKHKHRIMTICKRKKIPVFQAVKVDFKFKMTRVRIQ